MRITASAAPRDDGTVKYDAILVPGGGVRAGGVLPPWVVPRFDRALSVAGSAFLIPLSSGTPHRAPPLDEGGFAWTEARAGARYLVERGADPARILMEESSYDTIGNAYFSRTIHVVPRSFERVLVITLAFHMPRTEAIFRWVYGWKVPERLVQWISKRCRTQESTPRCWRRAVTKSRHR